MTRADLVVLLGAALLVGVSAAAFWQDRGLAAHVEIRVDDGEPRRYPLSQDRHIHVEGRLGVSELEIRDGRVRFVSGPCRNKVCIHSGWLSASGDATACLPNHVSIALTGNGAVQIDGVSQ